MKQKVLIGIFLICVISSGAWANNFGSSYYEKEASVTFTHFSALDSAWAVFGFDGDASGLDSANFYDSLKLLPAFSGDGTLLWGDGLKLDSIGVHVVKIRGYASGAIATMTAGIWENKAGDVGSSPWTAAGVGSVYVYLDSTANAITDPNKVNFKGEAAGLTADQIVDEFEDRGYGYGSGVFACTVYTKLDTDSSAIPSIHVIAKNTDQTQLLANGYTNANGWTVLGLDSIAGGAYHKFWLMNIEYSFTFPESADVNTNTSITFYGSAFDYGDPPTGNQCAVYGQLFDSMIDSLNGAVVKAEVFVPPDSVLRYDGHVISPFIVTDTTNVTGRWRLDLTPNSLFTPSGTWYIFTIEKPDPWGGIIVEKDTLTVPESESHKY